MKFLFLFNELSELYVMIRVADQHKYSIFKTIFGISNEGSNKLIAVETDTLLQSSSRAKNELTRLLDERKSNPPSIIDYEGRFKEEELFRKILIDDKEYIFQTSGPDNYIIETNNILILIDAAISAGKPLYLLWADNHKEYRDVRENILKQSLNP